MSNSIETQIPNPISSNTLPIIDYEALQTTFTAFGIHPQEFLPLLLDVFTEESTKLIQTMGAAIAQKDASSLNLAAHTLKSSSAGLGAMALADRCRLLEKMGQEGNLAHAQAVLTELEAYYQQTETALIAMLEEFEEDEEQ